MSAQSEIVVGVDGSELARRALDWALEEAAVRGVGCRLVHAWNYGMAATGLIPGGALEQIGEDAQTLLDQDVAYARLSGVAVEGRLVFGVAGAVLAEESRDADLLVVGSRGRSGLASTLLGSVSIACVHHSACPVVVIPPAERVSALQPEQVATIAH
ncbi:MAG TPA: universal stress protein [Acidimicrobiales bacterium]|nr:universal stress protein [Acidimicrobiales bacterium]